MTSHSITLNAKTQGMLRQFGFRNVCRNRNGSNSFMLIVGRQVNTPMVALSDDGHELGGHAAVLALLLAEPERADQRHGAAAGRVGAGDGPRPDPGDHGGLGAVGELCLWVE